jgi:acetyl-CoA C-acetyltransferase
VSNGETRIGGKRPVNLSGGLKACGHPVGATGVKQIVEIYNQLKGRGGRRQAGKVKLGLAHNVGGTGGTAVVHILRGGE